MKKIVWLLIFLPVILSAANGPASLVRIKIDSPDNIKQLYDMDIDVTRMLRSTGSVEAVITPADRDNLKEKGLLIETVIDDLDQLYFDMKNSKYFEHFHSVQQIESYLDSLVVQYPDLVQIVDIGDSYNKLAKKDGFDILAMKISDEAAIDDSSEADILYTASIHAREIITPEVLIVFIDYLLDGYGTNALATHLINNREMWFILCVNPDGRNYVFTGDYNGSYSSGNPIIWRKNLRDNNGDGIFQPQVDGVDLNRNFDYSWGFNDFGSSPKGSSEVYRGLAPFSEPETRAIKEFVEEKDFVISLFYHSYGDLWLYPWGFEPKNPDEPDFSSFTALNDSCVAYNGYLPDNGVTNSLGYWANGSSDDWLYGVHNIFAFTPEVGLSEDGGFWPNTSIIDILTYENLGPNLFMAWAAGEEPEIIDYSYNTFLYPSDDYTILASIKQPISLTGPVPFDTSSFKVYYRYGTTGAFDSLAMEYIIPIDRYQTKIPGNEYSGVIQYYISAKDSMGRIGTYPRGAPMALDSLVIDFPLAVEKDQSGLPLKYRLHDNYPNPFNSQTVISFDVAKAGEMSLIIYNTLGQIIDVLVQSRFEPGQYRKVWDGRDMNGSPVPSGVYFYELRGKDFHVLKKMVYIQ